MLEFEEDPDYDFLLNLFKKALENCDEEEPDFNWNKELKIERAESYHQAKTNNKSMLMNKISMNSHLVKGNDTSYSPGITKNNHMTNSIFLKPEEYILFKLFLFLF